MGGACIFSVPTVQVFTVDKNLYTRAIMFIYHLSYLSKKVVILHILTVIRTIGIDVRINTDEINVVQLLSHWPLGNLAVIFYM